METEIFIRDLLGINSDFRVTKIVKQPDTKEVFIHLDYIHQRHEIDGIKYLIYDHAPTRRWQHLDWFEYKCYIECALPRYINEAGKVKTIDVSFAPRSKGYTYKFSQRVIETLKLIQVQSTTAAQLNTTPYIIRSIMEDAVNAALEKRGFITDFKNVSLDEKAYKQGHLYASILIDSDTNLVLNLVEGRKEKSVETLFFELNEKESQPQIERVNIDMWKPYMNVMAKIAPYALQVHDKFHLVKKLSEAIDKTRKSEVKDNPILKNQKYTVLKNAENRTQDQQSNFDHICWENLQTSKAWLVRENFKSIFTFDHWQDKLYIYEQWLDDSLKTGLKYITPVIETFKRHYEGIRNAIVTDSSSGKHENINGQIQAVLAKSRGFANFDRFKINVMFYFGGLDLLPLKFY